MSSRITLVVAALAGAAGLVAAALWFAPGATSLQSGLLLPQPRALSEFTLQGDDGQPYTRARLLGHWTLLFPGFIHCPDTCPTTLAMLKQVRMKLGKESGLRVLFLSVDPERDTPLQLASYVHYFDASFTGATASEPELARVAHELAIAYQKVPGNTPDTYAMDHTAALILINPQAQVVAYFSPPFQPDVLVADLKASGAG